MPTPYDHAILSGSEKDVTWPYALALNLESNIISTDGDIAVEQNLHSGIRHILPNDNGLVRIRSVILQPRISYLLIRMVHETP